MASMRVLPWRFRLTSSALAAARDGGDDGLGEALVPGLVLLAEMADVIDFGLARGGHGFEVGWLLLHERLGSW